MRPGSLYGSLIRCLAALTVVSLLNINFAHHGSARAAGVRADFDVSPEDEGLEGDAAVTFGVDPDKVPFALKDGVKARYLSLSPGDFKVQLSKGAALGEVEFRRKSKTETQTTFTPAGGQPLLIRTVVAPKDVGKKAPDFDVIFQSGGKKAVLGVEQGRTPAPLSPGAERRVQNVISAATANPALLTLTRESAFSLSKPVVGRVLRRAFQYELEACIRVDPMDCGKETVFCLGAIAAYIQGVGGLLSACGVTVGATCIGALLLHPVLGAIVAFQCQSAVNACGYGSGDKKPCPKTLSSDFELILP